MNNRIRWNDESWKELNHLVMRLTSEKKLADALAAGNELFSLSKRNYGRKHANTATALNNLGIIHSLRKEFDDAESYLLAALQMSERVSGKLSRETAMVNMNLARLYTIKANAIYESIGIAERANSSTTGSQERTIQNA